MKPFFNNHQTLYSGHQPPMHDVGSIEGIALLEQSAKLIQSELTANLNDPQKAAACFRKYGLKKQAGWRQIELMVYGVSYPVRTALFPETMAVLSRIPGASTAYFSVLSPHSTISHHTGDTDAYYRVHLGLSVPAGLPACGIEVAGTQKSWEQGKCLAFTDIYPHSAWNHTNQPRIVLIVDILRPEFRDRQLWMNSGMRATLYWARFYEKAWPVIELMPRFLTRLGRPLFHWVAYGYFRLRGGVQ
jgi:aspartyl/asparaginyl beta-hydroxylase (cupin superfamily)